MTDAVYRLECCLGVSPGFSLHRARRVDDDMPVLVKRRSTGSADATRTADDEYALLRRLHCPAIVRPQALTASRDGALMELPDLPGVLLETLFGEGPLEAPTFLRLATHMVQALQAVHAAHLVAGDLRAAHWLVDVERQRAWLIDLSRATSDRPPIVAGAPPPDVDWSTLSPEQTGRLALPLDARSDFYALGVLLYRMLCGRAAFAAADPLEWVHCHLARQPTAPAQVRAAVPRALSDLVLKLLAKRPHERYQTAQGLLADLARLTKDPQQQPFALGAEDASGQFEIPRRLYGREDELATLQAAFEQVASQGGAALVTLCGAAGLGKSMLLRELQPTVLGRHGLMVSVGVDPQGRGAPGAAMAAALRALLQHTFAQSEEQVQAWRQRVGTAVGDDAALLVDLVPELDFLLGEPEPLPELPAAEAQHRLRRAVARFVRVFARRSQPLLLVFENLNGADATSLPLIEGLLARDGGPPQADCALMLLLAWRDDSTAAGAAVAALRARLSPLAEIQLQPLPPAAVARLLTDTLHAPEADVQPLARQLHARSGGNPLFITQALNALHDSGLLLWDASERRWSWDPAQIEAATLGDDVASLMAERLCRLPPDTQALLQLGSCVGPRFTLRSLARASACPVADLRDRLAPAAQEGLVLLDRDGARFTHERIRQAAYDMIDPAQRARLHQQLARSLLAELAPDALDDHLFDVCHHFGEAAALLHSEDERTEVARLHQRAGRRARTAAAHALAARMFAAGRGLLDEGSWAHHHELAFALALEQAECEFAAGQPEQAAALADALRPRAGTWLESAALEQLRIELQVQRSENAQAIASALACLQRLGIDLPAHPGADEVRARYRQ